MSHWLLVGSLILAQSTAPPQPCLSRQEAGDIGINAAAIAIEALVQRCRPHVGAGDFLNTGAERVVDRLRSAAMPRRESAFAAVGRMSQRRSTPAEQPNEADARDTDPEESSQQSPPFDPSANPEMMGGIMAGMAAGFVAGLDAAVCNDANDLVEALAPLPAENIAKAAGAMIGMVGTARPNDNNSLLCPA